jgi:hypothetical protein
MNGHAGKSSSMLELNVKCMPAPCSATHCRLSLRVTLCMHVCSAALLSQHVSSHLTALANQITYQRRQVVVHACRERAQGDSGSPAASSAECSSSATADTCCLMFDATALRIACAAGVFFQPQHGSRKVAPARYCSITVEAPSPQSSSPLLLPSPPPPGLLEVATHLCTAAQ